MTHTFAVDCNCSCLTQLFMTLGHTLSSANTYTYLYSLPPAFVFANSFCQNENSFLVNSLQGIGEKDLLSCLDENICVLALGRTEKKIIIWTKGYASYHFHYYELLWKLWRKCSNTSLIIFFSVFKLLDDPMGIGRS